MADADLIKRFLLGALSEEEEIRVENEYFTNPERFEEMEAAENDLIDTYVRGGLSGSERQLFRIRYLNSPARRSKVDFARALNEVAGLTVSSPKRIESGWWSLGALLDGPYLWPSVAFAAAGLVVMACGTWLITENRKLRVELNQAETARAELERIRDAQAQQIANLSKAASEPTPGGGR